MRSRGRYIGGINSARDRLDSGASWSGHERNHLFMNRQGQQFEELSALSGADSPADARSSVFLDFDRDGWLDIAVANANAPSFQLFRNRMGSLGRTERFVAIRLHGGNLDAAPSSEWSSRDGYGALVQIEVDGRILTRELRAGEGMAGQNSATLHVGIGQASSVDSIRVRWPSGRTQVTGEIAAGSLVDVYERDSTGSQAVAVAVYGHALPLPPVMTEPMLASISQLTLKDDTQADRDTAHAALRMYTTMATWCLPCRAEIPELERLRSSFSTGHLALIAVPIDKKDSQQMLEDWMSELDPPYTMLFDLTAGEVQAVEQSILDRLRVDGIPASLVTDGEGRILHVQWGSPSISKLRELLQLIGASGSPRLAQAG